MALIHSDHNSFHEHEIEFLLNLFENVVGA